ncbi:CD2-associated protein isoform X1 [Coregonus clupeaformis]|uniref:CD2-associated protein isoform X1 n=1 Tax=Coregonus clupeaformis TaxID=59861 RepID=UPI001BE01355|nr:CD2-associated protein isoform X1 [Coregonus clupeaformis]
MVEVVVEYEYEALHEDELTLRLGDVIRNVRRIEEEGWMEGDLNGKRGLFPDNFVKEVKKEPKEVNVTKEEAEEELPQQREKSAGNVANLVQRMSTYGFPAGGFQPHSQPRGLKKKSKKRQCKALFDYMPQNEDELELKIGDTIDINEEVEEGWWSGTMNGKSGLFPSNFVKEIETNEDGETDDVTDETDGSGKEALLPPTPTSPIDPSPGNGVIAQPKKIRGVGFGDIFKEGSVKLKVRLPSAEGEEKRDKPIPSLPSAAKPAHSITTDSQKAEGDSKAKVKEYCKATFSFESTNEDELTLKEGDVIQILSKDTGEPGWWRGEVGGKEGVFPDNFVTVMSDEDKEPAPTSRGSVKLSPKQEAEERPKKPPPPSKSIARKPEVPSADKKPQQPHPEDRGDKTDHKLSKPTAPLVPPKKPVPPPGKGRPGSFPPKLPDKPLTPSTGAKHNGEVPSTRPKSDFEPTLPSKPKTLSGEWGDKALDMELMSFDLSSISEKLSHPTANRPKMPGRRLPAQFGGGHSPNKDISVEKTLKLDEEEAPKPKLIDTRKPSMYNSHSQSPVLKPSLSLSEGPKAYLASAPGHRSPSPSSSPVPSRSRSPGPSTEPKPMAEPEERRSELEDLQSQMKELLLSVELLKTQQMREMAELRSELDEERLKRVALQMEIEKLKKTVQST